MIEPRKTKVTINGLQGGGKSYYAKACVVQNNMKVLVWSPHSHDFDSEPDNFYYLEDYHTVDVDDFFRIAIEMCKRGVIDGVLIDEFEMVFKSNFDIGKHATDAFANHRHYNMCIIGITRRPQDIPAYYFESCEHIICFAIRGENVKRKFNGMISGLGDAIGALPYEREKPNPYMHVALGSQPKRHEPI